MIEATDVGVETDGSPRFTELSVSIPDGSCVLLTGEDPKATLALGLTLVGVIPKLRRVDRFTGAVEIDSRNTRRLSGTNLAERIGVVFPNPATQLVGLTVDEDVRLAPENLGLSSATIEERVSAVTARLKIADLRSADPKDLSGGEKRRVAFAAAMAKDPDIFLVAEPTFNLDPDASAIIRDTIADLRSQGKTVLLTQSKLDETAELADRALVLRDGRLAHDLPGAAFRSDRALQSALGLVPPTSANPPVRDAPTPPGAAIGPTTSGKSPNLSVENLHFSYGSGPVLQGLDVQIDRGETLALVGANGSGKTTLAKQLNGLLLPDSGSIEFRGTDVTETPAAELASDIGYVFQEPDTQLYAPTVREEVAFGPSNLGVDSVEKRVAQSLSIVGLEGRRSASVGALSRGEKQRLAIASVLALDPTVLILDEPSTGLDYREFWAIMEAIESAFMGGDRSLVVVSHDWAIVDTWTDRTLAIRNGAIAERKSSSGDGSDTEEPAHGRVSKRT